LTDVGARQTIISSLKGVGSSTFLQSIVCSQARATEIPPVISRIWRELSINHLETSHPQLLTLANVRTSAIH
jgi:hypothetical protein